ncbi:MAG: carbohydrate binding domain-containing protein, partial [Candidatus Anstonellales archaeon]
MVITYLFSSDLKIVDPEDQTSAPDWGEIYIADDQNYIYFLFHNYKPVSSNITPNVYVWIDADNNPSTGDPGVNGADYRFKIAGLGATSDGWGTKIDPIEYWHTSWNSWQYITYKEEGGAPNDINGNQSNDGVQTLPTGRTAGVSCGILEFRFYKSWMVGSDRIPLGSVIAVDISGDDPVGSPSNRFTHTITNNQTRTVDGRVGTNEWIADAVPPAAISNLTALPGTNDGEIILRWTAPGDDGMTGTASSYIVKYATYQITNFNTQGTTYYQTWTPQPAGSLEQKTLAGFVPGTTYYFAIVAVDDSNNRGSWSTAGVNTRNYAPAQNLPPPAPTNITFYASDRKISLSWTAPNVPDINHYKIYYDTDNPNPPYTGTGATAGNSPINVGNVTSYILSGLVNFVTYYITITCVDNTNLESTYSTVISTTPFPRPNTPPSTPAKPTGPSIVAVGSQANFSTIATDPDENQIRYGWDWDGDGVVDEWTGYYDSGQICSISHYWNSAGNYQVRVKAQDTDGAESNFSEPLNVTVGTDDLFDDFEDVSDWWPYYGNGASLSTSTVAGVVGNALRFTFNTGGGYWGVMKVATNNNPYWNFNNGDWSIYKSFKFYMKGTGSTQIRIAIVEKDATGNQDGEWWVCTLTPTTTWREYEVTWASFTRRSEWQPEVTFRNQNTLDKDWIRAIHFIPQGTSGSNTIDIDEFYLVKDIDVTPPAAISNLTALSGTNDGEIILRWTAPGDDGMTGRATRYIVKYSLSQISNFNTQGTILPQNWQPNSGGQLEQRVITGLTPGVTYYFAIVAEDDWGNRGSWSTVGVNTQNYAPAQNLVPPPPSTVVAIAGDRTISISWSAVNVIDLKNYKVYYDTDNANPPYTGKGVDQGDSPIV